MGEGLGPPFLGAFDSLLSVLSPLLSAVSSAPDIALFPISGSPPKAGPFNFSEHPSDSRTVFAGILGPTVEERQQRRTAAASSCDS
jgi:hypothetical protein